MPDQITKERRKDENERGLSRGDPRVQPIASAGQACSQRRLRTPLCAGQENERAGPVNGEPCSAAAAAALLRLCSEEIFSSLVPVYHVVQKSASMLRLKFMENSTNYRKKNWQYRQNREKMEFSALKLRNRRTISAFSCAFRAIHASASARAGCTAGSEGPRARRR